MTNTTKTIGKATVYISDIQRKASEYINLLRDLRAATGDEASAVAILQEIGKDIRTQILRGRGNGNVQVQTQAMDSATEKQIGYLRDLGVEISPGLTRGEASVLIDEALTKAAA